MHENDIGCFGHAAHLPSLSRARLVLVATESEWRSVKLCEVPNPMRKRGRTNGLARPKGCAKGRLDHPVHMSKTGASSGTVIARLNAPGPIFQRPTRKAFAPAAVRLSDTSREDPGRQR